MMKVYLKAFRKSSLTNGNLQCDLWDAAILRVLAHTTSVVQLHLSFCICHLLSLFFFLVLHAHMNLINTRLGFKGHRRHCLFTFINGMSVKYIK